MSWPLDSQFVILSSHVRVACRAAALLPTLARSRLASRWRCSASHGQRRLSQDHHHKLLTCHLQRVRAKAHHRIATRTRPRGEAVEWEERAQPLGWSHHTIIHHVDWHPLRRGGESAPRQTLRHLTCTPACRRPGCLFFPHSLVLADDDDSNHDRPSSLPGRLRLRVGVCET